MEIKMSYGVMAFLVDTTELLNLSNSEIQKRSILNIFKSNENSKEEILQEFSADFDDLDENIREATEDDDSIKDPILSRQVLDEFMKGNLSNNAFDWVYAYVFKILCEFKGEFLDNSEWYPCSNESYFAIPFTSVSLPIEFPAPFDFPAITFIDHKTIKMEEARFESMNNEQANQLSDWINRAINEKRDLYLFYH